MSVPPKQESQKVKDPDPSRVRRVGRPVNAPKTAEIIATQIRRDIVRGVLKEEDALPSEAELLVQFGVSRPTLREAFRILEAESLITVRRGARGGARVTTFDPSVIARYVGLILQMKGTTISDVYEARVILETGAAGMLARNRTRADLKDLRDYIQYIQGILNAAEGDNDKIDIDEWAVAAYGFHDLILEHAGNVTVAVQGLLLREIVHAHLRLLISRHAGEAGVLPLTSKMIRSFNKLVDLVEERDSAGAENHWRTYMRVTGEILLRNENATNSEVIDLFS